VKKILFVAGDIGGASAQMPVYKKMSALPEKFEARVLVDGGPRAKAQDAWTKAGVPFATVDPAKKELIASAAQWPDVIISGSCATAYQLESEVVRLAQVAGKRSVILADHILSHRYSFFMELKPTNWFAIDSAHKEDILSRRPGLKSECVVVTGQPTYDSLKDILNRKSEIRKKHRSGLGIAEDDYLALYQSTGDKPAHFEVSLEMVYMGLKTLQRSKQDKLCFLPRLHPKLASSTKCENFTASAYLRVEEFCKNEKIKVVRADSTQTEELIAASDLLMCSPATTEGTKAVSLGCVVVFLAPDTVQYFFEKFLSCPYPFLPQIEKKAAFAVLKYCEVDDVFMASQRYPDEILANARNNFSLPEGFAVDNVINAVNNL